MSRNATQADVAKIKKFEYSLDVYDLIKATYGIDIAKKDCLNDALFVDNQRLKAQIEMQNDVISKLLDKKKR